MLPSSGTKLRAKMKPFATFEKDSMGSPSLARIARGNLCAGCGICQSIANGSVEMFEDEDGYIRPRQLAPIDEAAEALISRVCPGLMVDQQATGRTWHPLWGFYDTVQVGNARDGALRYRASSGGALSALLLSMLNSGTIDGVVQVEASTKPPYGNRMTVSTSYADLFDAAGSRYAPSAPLTELETLVGEGKRFAFVGKPCDVAALRSLIKLEQEYEKTFPYLVSFFCAGVPSIKGAEEIIRKMNIAPEQVTNFKYRGNGWPGRAVATLADGSSRSMTYHDSWGGILSKHVQHRCKICVDGTGDAADIVFADAWEADERGYPLFEERDGRSLVLVRTVRGREILEEAVEQDQINLGPFDISDLEKLGEAVTNMMGGGTEKKR